MNFGCSTLQLPASMLFAELPAQPFLRYLQENTLKQSKNK
jgi:hypothetical protein